MMNPGRALELVDYAEARGADPDGAVELAVRVMQWGREFGDDTTPIADLYEQFSHSRLRL